MSNLYVGALLDIRQMLADTADRKRATNKKLIGAIDGVNVNFVTYDKRLFDTTLVVYNPPNTPVGFTLNDSVSGSITLDAPPLINTALTADYYYQFWLDSELINFLNKGAEATSVYTDAIPDTAYLSIIPGMKSAALHLACSIANDALCAYLVNRRHSEEFNIEQDGNDDTGFTNMINALKDRSKMFWDRGMLMRDDYYKRQGKRNLPAFAIKYGYTKNYGPNR